MASTFQSYSVLSTSPIVSSSSGSSFFPFGFNANHIEVENLGTLPMWVKLGSSSTGSTGDLCVTSCVSGLPNMITVDLGINQYADQVRVFATSTAGNQFCIRALG